MVEESIGVVEYIPLADGVVVVVVAEGIQCPIGDVFFAVAAVFVVGVEGEGYEKMLLYLTKCLVDCLFFLQCHFFRFQQFQLFNAVFICWTVFTYILSF